MGDRRPGDEVDAAASGHRPSGIVTDHSPGPGQELVATRLVRRGVPPLAAGMAVGTAALVLVDEGIAIAQFFPYPVESHLRGVVGHATVGTAIGTFLSLLAQS